MEGVLPSAYHELPPPSLPKKHSFHKPQYFSLSKDESTAPQSHFSLKALKGVAAYPERRANGQQPSAAFQTQQLTDIILNNAKFNSRSSSLTEGQAEISRKEYNSKTGQAETYDAASLQPTNGASAYF